MVKSMNVKFETKVIQDSNLDFRINLDPYVRRIRPKIVDALSRRRQSLRQVWYKSAVDYIRIEKTEMVTNVRKLTPRLRTAL